MHRAKIFFYVCLGILALAGAFHLGAQSAQSQVPGNPIVAAYAGAAFTANGDVYAQLDNTLTQWEYRGNILGAGPVQSIETTWGRVKAERR
jgi:hypothetical protein